MAAIGVLLVLIGLLMMVKPSVLWAVTESWKSGDATEPSVLYLWSTRLGGALMTVAGAAAVAAGLLE
ncbi:DUF6199 family natural product biosynthesis protein [Paenibacillus silviterrae]|uniref:DUF6199 family natural product biosynthesis protein n=1 Tax=Paenibacillus silviterrae TaxID=3242194 RepID=UPI0025436EF2|nr:DUF6199 family natural product biosynthesis protein [Paenibacillus chinjuensis]